MKRATSVVLMLAVIGTMVGCASETYDYTPSPPNFGSRFESTGNHLGDIGDNLTYYLLGTNCSMQPYDTFGKQFESYGTNFRRTIDLHFFRYDWDDPYVD